MILLYTLKKQRVLKKCIRLTDTQTRTVVRFLAGELTTREAARELNCSHQTVINFVCRLARQWYQQGKLKI